MHKLRILIYDIETTPLRAWIWSTGKQYVTHDQIMLGDHPDIITISWKWLGKKGVHSLNWGLKEQNSEPMLRKFSKVIESADIVIGHNCKSFDNRHLNTQRLLRGLPPINWPSVDDSLLQFRSLFYFPSYRLDYLSKLLTGSGKDVMAFQDWIDIVQHKKPEALDKMIRYNKRDVIKTAKIIRQALPFMKLKTPKHPCAICGSRHSQSKGYKNVGGKKYQIRQCMDCGERIKKLA